MMILLAAVLAYASWRLFRYALAREDADYLREEDDLIVTLSALERIHGGSR